MVVSDQPAPHTASSSNHQQNTSNAPNSPGKLVANGSPQRSAKEKFNVNTQTGGIAVQIPITTSPGRSGLGPSLNLVYDSGSATVNGAFGVGWRLDGVARITRKTSTGIPVYTDEDTFTHSNLGDLVPLMDSAEVDRPGYWVRAYRPRIEGDPIRIEHWVAKVDASQDHWRTINSDNVTVLYGKDLISRVANRVEDREDIFSWLQCETYDSHGNQMLLSYKSEDQTGINQTDDVSEACRSVASHQRQRYLKSIKYGNRTPNRDTETWDMLGEAVPREWLFQVVLDYGEHDKVCPTAEEVTPWAARPDAFSVHRSGFEIRTYRRCQRILMFHHFPELERTDYLVASTCFEYETNPRSGVSVLNSCTGWGHRASAGGGYSNLAMPSTTFEYSTPPPLDDLPVEELDLGLSTLSDTTKWVDLHGEGAPGILVDCSGGWYYCRNQSDEETVTLGSPSLVPCVPSLASSNVWSFEDVTGNGLMDVVVHAADGSLHGFYEHADDGEWANFREFESDPTDLLPNDPDLRKLDINGDGQVDILRMSRPGDHEMTWHASLGHRGYDGAKRTFDAPLLSRRDAESVFMCDMDGDGLSDIVCIRNGIVYYWPNMGHGRFGEKVIMEKNPLILQETDFSRLRIRMVDVTGSGTTDLLYFPPSGGVAIFYNQSGNRWSCADWIQSFPPLDRFSAVDVFDLHGTGAQSLCWMSDLNGTASAARSTNLRFIDLMGGSRPGLLTKWTNGMGLETNIEYRSSTLYYRDAEKGPNPWSTRLPFSIDCVSKTITTDLVAQTSTTSRYSYHNGSYDGAERQFRGFQMVEVWDAEDFFTGATKARFQQPPTRSRTWFYTGLESIDATNVVAGSFETTHPQQESLVATAIPESVTTPEVENAYRALGGRPRRQEIFADDGSPRSAVPYVVSQQAYELVKRQSAGPRHHAVFRVDERESVTAHCERDLDQARVEHHLILARDEYGNVLQEAEVAYGKASSDLQHPQDCTKQSESVVVYTETNFTNAITSQDDFRAPVVAGERKYRLFPHPASGSNRYSCRSLRSCIQNATQELISQTRTLYSKSDLSSALPLGQVEPYSLEYQSYQLAFTMEMLLDALPMEEGGLVKELANGHYIELETGQWWVPSDRPLFEPSAHSSILENARSHFYIPHGAIHPNNATSMCELDSHKLLPVKCHDAVKNSTTFDNDYAALQARTITDANKNQTETVYDPLRRSVGIAIMGKKQEGLGDSLQDFTADVTTPMLQAFIDNPIAVAPSLLGTAGRRVIYDTSHYQREGKPTFSAELVRDTHYRDGEPQISIHITYSDGQGNAIQTASLSGQAEWQFSSWVINDNKGQPVRAFQPFTALSHAFQPQQDHSAPATSFLRDPVGRVVAVLNADHTWSKTRLTPWKQVIYDAGDTSGIEDPRADEDVGPLFEMLETEWFLPGWSQANEKATLQSMVYHDTPSVVHLDVLGRGILTILDNGRGDTRSTRKQYDLSGNVTELQDALDRVAQRSRYDLLGRAIRTVHMDSGVHSVFPSYSGLPILSWSNNSPRQRVTYDALGREKRVSIQTSDSQPEVVIVKNVYGEAHRSGEGANLRGQLYKCYDQSGLHTNNSFDFHGNCTKSTIRHAADYKSLLDVARPVRLESPVYTLFEEFNAVGLTVRSWYVGGDCIIRMYDVAGRLKTVRTRLRNSSETDIVENIDYSADNLITKIEYGNQSQTEHTYDIATRRLLRTRIGSSSTLTRSPALQDIAYTYDCVGKLVEKTDHGQRKTFFKNQAILPSQSFQYDALGQLVQATGREKVNVSNGGEMRLRPDHSFPQNIGSSSRDNKQMVQYTEQYTYDKAGNILRVNHQPLSAAGFSGWSREYSYKEPSCLEPESGIFNNRLSSTQTGGGTETYKYEGISGENGCMTALPGYTILNWDHNNRLRSYSSQRVSGSTSPEMTWYIYNAQGQRVRKVTERAATGGFTRTKMKETCYLPLRDIYTNYTGNGHLQRLKIDTSILHEPAVSSTPLTLIEHSPGITDTLFRYQMSENLELDDDSRTVSYEEYAPFGACTYRSCLLNAPRKYRFAGYQHDTESNLYHCGERYYAAWLGRWTSTDPWGTVDGPNLYAYVANDPLNWDDHEGTNKKGANKKNLTTKTSMDRRKQVVQKSSNQAEAKGEIKEATPKPEGKGIFLYRATTAELAEKFKNATKPSVRKESILTHLTGDFNHEAGTTAYFTTSPQRAKDHAHEDGMVIRIWIPQEFLNDAIKNTEHFDVDKNNSGSDEWTMWFSRVKADRLGIPTSKLVEKQGIKKKLRDIYDRIIQGRGKEITIGPELKTPTAKVEPNSTLDFGEVVDAKHLGNGIKDNVQVYNIPKFDGHHHRQQPAILVDHLDEIEAFSRKCHTEVVEKLLRLFAILLQLPDEGQLVRDHKYDAKGEDHLRYMHYAARGLEENKKVGDLYSPGHTDLGTVTLLFRQPVAALQILNSEGQWKWVCPQDGTITINTCDALTALTGGLIKSSVHRVHAPPPDQAHVDRLGVLYFARPNNHVILDPIQNSPLLNELGLTQNAFTDLGQHLTTEQWVKVRQTQQQRRRQEAKISDDGKYTYAPKDLEVIPGLHAKVYN